MPASDERTTMIFTDSDIDAILLSLRVSGLAVLVFLVPGALVGVWLGSGRSRARSVVQLVLNIPLVVPPVVTGLLLLKLMLYLGIPLVFTWWAAVGASGVVALPLLVRTACASAEATDRRLVTVAETLGASRLRILRTVLLPLCRRGIVGGALLFWARAMGEFGAVMVVAGNTPGRTQTIPLAIYSKLESTREQSIWPLVCVSIVISVVAVLLSERFSRRVEASRSVK